MVSGRDWLLTFLISGWRYEFEQGELFVYGVFDTSPWHLHRMSGLRMKITGEAQRLDTTDSETNKSIRDVKTSMATLADKSSHYISR